MTNYGFKLLEDLKRWREYRRWRKEEEKHKEKERDNFWSIFFRNDKGYPRFAV